MEKLGAAVNLRKSTMKRFVEYLIYLIGAGALLQDVFSMFTGQIELIVLIKYFGITAAAFLMVITVPGNRSSR